jgi:hypothetical protein
VLDDFSWVVRENTWFVHDGVPPTFQHILSTGGPTVWCQHLPDLSAVDCFVGTWKLYTVTPYSKSGTELKTAVTTPKDASDTFDVPNAGCIRSHRGYFVHLVWNCILWVCTGSNENKTQHLKFRKGNQKWLRMDTFPDSCSHNIACLCFVLVTLTVVLDLWLLNDPHLHTWTRV